MLSPPHKLPLNNIKNVKSHSPSKLLQNRPPHFSAFIHALIRYTILCKNKVYNSYLRFTGYDTSWQIIREGDTTTDRNLAKRKVGVASVSVDNETPLEDIFCAQNVGKYLEADYWSLVLSSDDGETEGPLASAMIDEGATARLFISGILKRNYRGRSGTIYCGGICEAGESESIVVWVYDTRTGTLSCEY